MKYADSRRHIKTGDILAFGHKAGWFKSWYDFKINFIRLMMRRKYSHVAVAWVIAGRVMMLESVTGGIRPFPLSKCLPCDHITYKPMDVDKAMSVCGEQYSIWECVKGFFGRSMQANKKWQCSKYVVWVHDMPCDTNPPAVVDYALSQGGCLTSITEY